MGRLGGQEDTRCPWRPPFLPLVSGGCRSKSYVGFLYYKQGESISLKKWWLCDSKLHFAVLLTGK